jgi:hypothetical protein
MPGVPPVPIPNTAVKPRAADGSRALGPARVGRCQVYGPVMRKHNRAFLFVSFRQSRRECQWGDGRRYSWHRGSRRVATRPTKALADLKTAMRTSTSSSAIAVPSHRRQLRTSAKINVSFKGVIPFGMEGVGGEVERVHFLIGYFSANRIGAFVQNGADFEAGGGGRFAD